MNMFVLILSLLLNLHFCDGYFVALCTAGPDVYGCRCSEALCPPRYSCYDDSVYLHPDHPPKCYPTYHPPETRIRLDTFEPDNVFVFRPKMASEDGTYIALLYHWGHEGATTVPSFCHSYFYDKNTTPKSTFMTRRTTPGADTVHLLQVTLSIYSGNQDPVFNIFFTNANFSAIVATAKSRASVALNGILGYRGFQVILYSHAGSQTVIIGKCSDPRFEETLLHTITRLTDTTGARLVSSTVTAVENAIKACH